MSLHEYFVIEKNSSLLSKEKSSKFIAYSFMVTSEEEVKSTIEELWNEHPKATHICYAYRIGADGNRYRANDDGEPSGTAGKPILSQIDSAQFSDCLVAVVRYYGGTKLGVSGLINAYKVAAKDCLNISGKLLKEVMCSLKLTSIILHSNDWMRFIKQNHLRILDFTSDATEACWIVEFPLKNKEEVLHKFNSIYQWPFKLELI